MFLMADMFVHGENLKAARLAAARHGADAVLVVEARTATQTYRNTASLLYWTVVGGYVVPGTHCDATCVVQGGLVDVNNGFLYASASCEAESKLVRPSFVLDERDAITTAKSEAVTSFATEFAERMRSVGAVMRVGGAAR
jgi:rhombotail lipoprotein